LILRSVLCLVILLAQQQKLFQPVIQYVQITQWTVGNAGKQERRMQATYKSDITFSHIIWNILYVSARSIYCAIMVSRSICPCEMETCRKQDIFSCCGIVVKAGCTFVFILASRQPIALEENPPLMVRRHPRECYGRASVR